jgi:hypothetical protein
MVSDRVHTVAKGESLDSIARKYGIKHWSFLYNARVNAPLRHKRPRPDQIKPGDTIVIPPDPIAAAQAKLEKLKKLRADYVKMSEDILLDWEKEYSKTSSSIDQIDGVGKVATILISLGSIIKGGFSAMKLSGDALEKANKDLAKQALDFAYMPAAEAAAGGSGILDVKEGDGRLFAFGKKTVSFFLLDWNSPSYWASLFTGTDMKQINTRVKKEIKDREAETLQRLDLQILKAENDLTALRAKAR